MDKIFVKNLDSSAYLGKLELPIGTGLMEI